MAYKNLHLLPDDKFVERFIYNVRIIDKEEVNKFVIKSDKNNFKFLKEAFPYGKPGSAQFDEAVGDISSYENIFVHFFNPFLYEFFSNHKKKNVNWMIWGGDLYQRNDFKGEIYETLTKGYINKSVQPKGLRAFDIRDIYRLFKKKLYNYRFEQNAFSKVCGVLTWMEEEFDYASKTIGSLSAKHVDFHYDLEFDLHVLNELSKDYNFDGKQPVRILLGNSATPTNNHLDALSFIKKNSVKDFDFVVPVSYGVPHYREAIRLFLNSNHFHYGFIEEYLSIKEYLNLLNTCDILLFNHLRPQGVGNILMAMLLNKPVLLNKEGLLYKIYRRKGYDIFDVNEIDNVDTIIKSFDGAKNKQFALEFISHSNLLEQYRQIFT